MLSEANLRLAQFGKKGVVPLYAGACVGGDGDSVSISKQDLTVSLLRQTSMNKGFFTETYGKEGFDKLDVQGCLDEVWYLDPKSKRASSGTSISLTLKFEGKRKESEYHLFPCVLNLRPVFCNETGKLRLVDTRLVSQSDRWEESVFCAKELAQNEILAHYFKQAHDEFCNSLAVQNWRRLSIQSIKFISDEKESSMHISIQNANVRVRVNKEATSFGSHPLVPLRDSKGFCVGFASPNADFAICSSLPLIDVDKRSVPVMKAARAMTRTGQARAVKTAANYCGHVGTDVARIYLSSYDGRRDSTFTPEEVEKLKENGPLFYEFAGSELGLTLEFLAAL